MPKTVRLSNFPQQYWDILDRVKEQGLFSVKFDTHKQAMAFRLRFYSFIYSVREQASEKLDLIEGVAIRHRGEWIEIGKSIRPGETNALDKALSRGFSLPINEEDII